MPPPSSSRSESPRRRLILGVVLGLVVAVAAYKARHHRPGLGTRLRGRSMDWSAGPLSLLTANVQRLPYLVGRGAPDVAAMLRGGHDVVCLQEDFQPLLTLDRCRRDAAGGALLQSHCWPAGSAATFLNSGLSVWSRYPLRVLSFERFRNLTSVDRLADKGFLAVEVGARGAGLIVVNTHLQATYDYRDVHYGVARAQVRQILDWLDAHHRARPALVVGDFNYDIREEPDPPLPGVRRVHPASPTHWTRMDSVFETSSAVPRHGFLPLTCDGAMFAERHAGRLRVADVATHRYDPHTDHLAVSFRVRITGQ